MNASDLQEECTVNFSIHIPRGSKLFVSQTPVLLNDDTCRFATIDTIPPTAITIKAAFLVMRLTTMYQSYALGTVLQHFLVQQYTW